MKTTSKSIRNIIYGILIIVVIVVFISIEKTLIDQEKQVVLAAGTIHLFVADNNIEVFNKTLL